jgi:hypothetical protein
MLTSVKLCIVLKECAQGFSDGTDVSLHGLVAKFSPFPRQHVGGLQRHSVGFWKERVSAITIAIPLSCHDLADELHRFILSGMAGFKHVGHTFRAAIIGKELRDGKHTQMTAKRVSVTQTSKPLRRDHRHFFDVTGHRNANTDALINDLHRLYYQPALLFRLHSLEGASTVNKITHVQTARIIGKQARPFLGKLLSLLGRESISCDAEHATLSFALVKIGLQHGYRPFASYCEFYKLPEELTIAHHGATVVSCVSWRRPRRQIAA